MSYRDFKDFPGRTASDKVLRDKTFNIAKNPKYDGYQRVLASVLYNFLFKKSNAANTCTTRAQSKALVTWLHYINLQEVLLKVKLC